jgi:transposase
MNFNEPLYRDSLLKNKGFLMALGEIGDPELGEQFNITRQRVEQFRKKLSIPRYEPHKKDKRFLFRHLKELGSMPAEKFAETFKMDLEFVRHMKTALNVNGFSNIFENVQKHTALLGKVSDYELSRRTGIPYHQIRIVRHKLGIPSWQKRRLNKVLVRELYREGKTHAEIAEIVGARNPGSINMALAAMRKQGQL